MEKRFAGLILAAGYSSRMQGLKAVLPFGEKTVIERQTECFSDAGICDIFVVVGHRAESIVEVIGDSPVSIVHNYEYEKGMFSSVKAGVKAINPEEFEAVFLSPVDYPLMQPYTLKALSERYNERQAKIIYPCHKGRKGHPPLFSSNLFADILNMRVQGNLKEVFPRYDAEYVEMGNPTCLMDIDTKEEYEQALSYLQNHIAPDTEECEYIYRKFDVPEGVIAHCRKVSDIALAVASELNKNGCDLNPQVIYASSLLHDIAKGGKDHARVGAEILKSMGYPRIGRCIENHMEIGEFYAQKICEESVLYIADKVTKNDRAVSIEERMTRITNEPYADIALKRLNTAKCIQANIENALGMGFMQFLSSKAL